MKLCVFPNDPIKSYYEKGEIKERYFNPNNLFDEIHVISFSENEIESSKVQELAGEAKLVIHRVGKITIFNKSKKKNQVLKLIKEIKPQVIRAYNPRLEGWCAATCSEKLKIPMFLSLHTQLDYKRKLICKTNFKKFLALKYTEKFVEPYVLKKAKKIIIVFKVIESYVIKHVGKKPELLYNSIDYERFAKATPLDSLPKPMIISIGNLIKEKNHECLINAMKDVEAYCLIIGKGDHFQNLVNLIKKQNLEQKISIIKSVPYSKIQNYYKSAQVFALAYDPELEGLPKPVVEAMAVGLPVIIPYPKEGYSDDLEDTVIFSNRDSFSFSKNIRRLLNNQQLRNTYSQKSQNKAKEFDITKIEKREADIYTELISRK